MYTPLTCAELFFDDESENEDMTGALLHVGLYIVYVMYISLCIYN